MFEKVRYKSYLVRRVHIIDHYKTDFIDPPNHPRSEESMFDHYMIDLVNLFNLPR